MFVVCACVCVCVCVCVCACVCSCLRVCVSVARHPPTSDCEAQAAADACYKDPVEWTRRSILSTAGMGKFSTDRTYVGVGCIGVVGSAQCAAVCNAAVYISNRVVQQRGQCAAVCNATVCNATVCNTAVCNAAVCNAAVCISNRVVQ